MPIPLSKILKLLESGIDIESNANIGLGNQ